MACVLLAGKAPREKKLGSSGVGIIEPAQSLSNAEKSWWCPNLNSENGAARKLNVPTHGNTMTTTDKARVLQF
jgi:hypothetical protein